MQKLVKLYLTEDRKRRIERKDLIFKGSCNFGKCSSVPYYFCNENEKGAKKQVGALNLWRKEAISTWCYEEDLEKYEVDKFAKNTKNIYRKWNQETNKEKRKEEKKNKKL